MLAEAIHSVADSGNQVLLLLGGKRARARGDPAAPVRLRPRALRLRVHRRRSCCSASAACSRSTRRTTSATRCTQGKPNELLEGRWWWVAVVVLVVAIVHGGLLLPHRDPRDATRSGAGGPGCEFIRRPRRPSCPVILLEDFAALIGLVLALLRRRPDPAHRQRHLGRRRHRGDRPAARGRRDRARRSRPRACCSGRPPARAQRPAIAEALERRPASSGSSTCGRCTSARRSCWWRPRSACAPERRAPPTSPPRSTPPSVRSARPCRPPVIYLEPDIDRRRGDAARPQTAAEASARCAGRRERSRRRGSPARLGGCRRG